MGDAKRRRERSGGQGFGVTREQLKSRFRSEADFDFIKETQLQEVAEGRLILTGIELTASGMRLGEMLNRYAPDQLPSDLLRRWVAIASCPEVVEVAARKRKQEGPGLLTLSPLHFVQITAPDYIPEGLDPDKETVFDWWDITTLSHCTERSHIFNGVKTFSKLAIPLLELCHGDRFPVICHAHDVDAGVENFYYQLMLSVDFDAAKAKPVPDEWADPEKERHLTRLFQPIS